MERAADPNLIVLSYHHSDGGSQNWKNKEYPVRLNLTRCNYGGDRVWFLCPAQGCGRRVAVLYGPPVFACRQCHQLVYDSQRMPSYDRALEKAQTIRIKLGGSGSMAEFFPPKPKGMHTRTYKRLRLEAEAADEMSWPPFLKALVQRPRSLR